MLGSTSLKKTPGAPLQSRKAMLETLFRHLDMVRLSAGAIVLMTLASCAGLIDGSGDGLTTQERTARKQWTEKALPALKTNCGSCHAGSRPNLDFISGTTDLEIRDRIKTYTPSVVNLDAPGSSRLVVKDQHEGPAFSVEDRAAVVTWLLAEQSATTHDPITNAKPIATAPMAIQPCTAGLPPAATCPTNEIPLTDVPDIGAMIPGAKITFIAQPLSTGLYLSQMKVVGGTAGVYFEHPLFVSVPATGDPVPDSIDRFFDTKLDVKGGATTVIGGGTEEFNGFASTDMLRVYFKAVALYKPEAGGGTNTGCKRVDLFGANVSGKISAVPGNCVSCHAAGSAKAALDLTGAGATDTATVTSVCNQFRTGVNLTTPDISAIYLAPMPNNNTNHPFKFAAADFTAYKTAVDIWINGEKTAP
jgi:mono/diheme cytochrome c family protein